MFFQPNEVEPTENLQPLADSPNILELGLVSKTTLQNLGIKLRGEEKEISNDINEEVVEVEEEILETQSPTSTEPGLYFAYILFQKNLSSLKVNTTKNLFVVGVIQNLRRYEGMDRWSAKLLCPHAVCFIRNTILFSRINKKQKRVTGKDPEKHVAGGT